MFDNSWSPGLKHFEWSPGVVPLGTRSARFEAATLVPQVGAEVIVVVFEATDLGNDLGGEILRIGMDRLIVRTVAGPALLLLWWVPPVANGKPFALYACVLNPSDPSTLDLLQRVSEQTHLHLALIGKDAESLGTYEFKNKFSFGSLIRFVQSACQDYAGMDFRRAELSLAQHDSLLGLFRRVHRAHRKAHLGCQLTVRGQLPTFSFAAGARISAIAGQSANGCTRDCHQVFSVVCSQSSENNPPSRITFQLAQFFEPIIEYAVAVYDAVAKVVVEVDVANEDSTSLWLTLGDLGLRIRDDLLPQTFEEVRVESGPLVALPIKFLTPAVDLLWNAWDTFDHPLQKQFDSEMREALRHVDDPEDHNGRDLAERLRKRLALRHDHWLVAADVRVAGIAAARAVPEDGTLASGRKPARRTAKYEAINSALCEIAKAMPEDHEEVFQFLDSRTVPIPNRDPFKTEKGWLKGFERDRPAARSWLSRTWSSLGLSPFARGPKKK